MGETSMGGSTIYALQRWCFSSRFHNMYIVQLLSYSYNFFLFEFWWVEKIILIISLWIFLEHYLASSHFPNLSLAFWLFGVWKKVGNNVSYEKNLTACPKHPSKKQDTPTPYTSCHQTIQSWQNIPKIYLKHMCRNACKKNKNFEYILPSMS